MDYMWLPGWYATKLHAVSQDKELPVGMGSIMAECGAFIYGKAPTEWAQRKVDKGVPHCKKCERLLNKATGETK